MHHSAFAFTFISFAPLDQGFIQWYVAFHINVELWVPSSDSPHKTATALINKKRVFVKGSVGPAYVQYVSLLDLEPRRVEKIHIDASALVCNQKLSNLPFFCSEIPLPRHYDYLYFDILFWGGQIRDWVRGFSPEDEGIWLLEEVPFDLNILLHLVITLKSIKQNVIKEGFRKETEKWLVL